MKASELVRLLKRHGWYEDRQSGSHKTFKHPANPKIITVPIHSGDLRRGLVRKLLRIAGLS
jgi:predicted RNA binding protein YcfA (HicA-like mRNA interferase family)